MSAFRSLVPAIQLWSSFFAQAIKDLLAQDPTPLRMEPLWCEITRRQPAFKGLLHQDMFECWQLLASLNFLKALFSITKRSITCCGLDHQGCGFSSEAVDSANVWGMPMPPAGLPPADWLDETLSMQPTQVQHLPDWICPCCGALGDQAASDGLCHLALPLAPGTSL